MEKATFRTEVLQAVLQATREFISKDETRLGLTHLCVEAGGENKIKMTAADGHTMCRVVAGAAESALKNDGTKYELTSEEIGVLLARCKTREPTVTVELRGEQTASPAFEKVIPPWADDARPGCAAARFDALYLARIGKVQRALGATGSRLQFGERALDPLRVDVTGADDICAIVMIMPMRL